MPVFTDQKLRRKSWHYWQTRWREIKTRIFRRNFDRDILLFVLCGFLFVSGACASVSARFSLKFRRFCLLNKKSTFFRLLNKKSQTTPPTPTPLLKLAKSLVTQILNNLISMVEIHDLEFGEFHSKSGFPHNGIASEKWDFRPPTRNLLNYKNHCGQLSEL